MPANKSGSKSNNSNNNAKTYAQKQLKKATERAFSRFPTWFKIILFVAIIALVAFAPSVITHFSKPSNEASYSGSSWQQTASDKPYELDNDNKPSFSKSEISTEGYVDLSELDSLGRCGPALACIGKETMPTEKRGDISSVKPTGWHTVKYPELIKDKYLYNRCHLIGFQLSGLNAEKRNLITGTRHLNVEGMLPFEDEIADYVKDTGNHVMYRVTPDFKSDELVARGVIMEAYSVEDDGKGVSFSVYCFNIQPGILIDYATGESKIAGE